MKTARAIPAALLTLALGFAGAMTGGQAEPQAAGPEPDLAFGAFQRGLYQTALQEALKRVAANPGDAPAMTLLGELYRDGLAVRRDPAEAAKWYRLAAARGDRQAQFALAIAHLGGAGVDKSPALARQWFEKAAAQDHAGALYNLGVMELESEVQDARKAAAFFEKAADRGDPDAAYGLAILLRAAAEARHVAAMVEYGIALFNGEGGSKDEAGAARLFAKAAAQHSAVGQNRLARLYVSGRGVKPNIVEAMKWHILARAGGLSDPWLESKLPGLSAQERAAVEQAVQRFIGK